MNAQEQEREAPQFHIGARVRARDGAEGTIEQVVINPENGRVTDLVVSLDGLGATPHVVIPTDCVLYTGAAQVEVDLSREELAQLPRFEDTRFRKPDESWPGLPEYTPDVVLFWAPTMAVGAFVPHNVVTEPNVEGVRNVPPGTVAISADMDVICGEEVLGHVDRILVDADEERATHLVVRSGVLGREERMVPVSHVREVTDTAVELDCPGRGLEEFPPFKG